MLPKQTHDEWFLRLATRPAKPGRRQRRQDPSRLRGERQDTSPTGESYVVPPRRSGRAADPALHRLTSDRTCGPDAQAMPQATGQACAPSGRQTGRAHARPADRPPKRAGLWLARPG